MRYTKRAERIGSDIIFLAEYAVMVFHGISHVLAQPCGGEEGEGILFCLELNLRQEQPCKLPFKYIQLSSKPSLLGDEITLFGNQVPIHFCTEVHIGFFC